MPEFRECYAHYLMATKFWEKHCDSSDFRLLAIWADRSKDENEQGLGVEPVANEDAYVLPIDGSYNYLRGNQNHQTALYPTPEQLQQAAIATSSNALDDSPNLGLSVLSLKGFDHTARSLIIHFGFLWFQLSFLTHTSVQIFSREQWETSVKIVKKSQRKYKIAICFEFEESFFAFPSLDMLVQPVWGIYPTPPRLGIEIPYVWDDFNAFLEKVASWAEPLLNRSSCPSVHAIGHLSKEQEIWPGVGVYSSSELFFDAGIPPSVALYELVSVPSRLARLACAYLSFALKARDLLWSKVLQPAIVQGILAPTIDQRLKYCKAWVHVWAKPNVRVTPRQKCLISNYTAKLDSITQLAESTSLFRMQISDLYDPFEPAFIRQGLDMAAYLGPTIFGNAWPTIQGRPAVSPETIHTPNPLDQMYSRVQQTNNIVNVHAQTFLNIEVYEQLYAKLSPTVCQYVRTQAFKISTRPVWSVVPPLSSSLQIIPSLTASLTTPARNIRTPKAHVQVYTPAEEQQSYFETIVSCTEGVAIGPLEYCGNGQVFKDSHQKTILHLTPSDARLTEVQVAKLSKRSFRKKLNKKTSLKSGLSQSQTQKRDATVQSLVSAFQTHRNARSTSISSRSSTYSTEHSDTYSVGEGGSNKDDAEDDNEFPVPRQSLAHTPPSHSENEAEIPPVVTKRRRLSQDQRLAFENMTTMGL